MSQVEIIDRPDLRSLTRSATEWGFTTLIWALWCYLFMPLVSLVLWLSGLRHAHLVLIGESGLEQLLQLCTRMGWVVVIFVILFKGWQWYNFRRFSLKERSRRAAWRKMQASPGLPFNLRPADIEVLQNSREIYWRVAWDGNGIFESAVSSKKPGRITLLPMGSSGDVWICRSFLAGTAKTKNDEPYFQHPSNRQSDAKMVD